jgi:hypothetical protein
MEEYIALYDQIKKRISDYRLTHGFLVFCTFICAILFVFSLLPLVPVAIFDFIGLTTTSAANSILFLIFWVVCVVILGYLFSRLNKKTLRVEEKYGITLEERLYLRAYESMKFLEQYLDPKHPIASSKMKAVRKLTDIDYLLDSSQWRIPNIYVLSEEAQQMKDFKRNLERKLIPAIKKSRGEKDKEILDTSRATLRAMVEHLARPELVKLQLLNDGMSSLPEITERGIYVRVKTTISQPSNLKHILAIGLAAILSFAAAYADIVIFSATEHDAYALGIYSLIGIVGVYATFVALKKSKT